MEIRIRPVSCSDKFALELDEFWPKGGYIKFLKSFCHHIGAGFLDWQQRLDSGVGHIRFDNEELVVYWSDFPDTFSFDCNSQVQAERLKHLVDEYLAGYACHESCRLSRVPIRMLWRSL
ncbi:MAG: hypothetical protein LW709_05765 [Oxalobacteraceae bacterium]|nr:hypothetical protein [Oxalobacteraceae bacterium]MCE2831564.1 hypothetical protein [Oxalobacteraceae bacterium]